MNITLNGRQCTVGSDGTRTLLEVLREDFGLTGTKYGCGEGQCRACTVLMDGKAVPSCLIPVGDVEGHSVQTIEGLGAEGLLHPVQQAFIDESAMQCGYCVPGMILATVALLKNNPKPSRPEIVEALNGNLCRCCGYVNILRAVERAAQAG